MKEFNLSKKIMALLMIAGLSVSVQSAKADPLMDALQSGTLPSEYSAVLSTPVGVQLGGYLSQLNSYNEAFRNMDMYMLSDKKTRKALKAKQKAARDCGETVSIDTMYDRNAGWVSPFGSFEKVGVHNGPKVQNIMYGMYFGGESDITDLGKGWDGMWGAYVGYNGSHQSYDQVGTYQNGGTVGITGMAFKDDFFVGGTINVGGSAGHTSSYFDKSDNFAMITSGIAAKTGYNWELADGKFIIQPSLLASYTFIYNFDYWNSTGADIKAHPLNAIQIEPGLKFIGNLNNGWQPYAGVSFVYNIMDRTYFKANHVSLPNLGINPYVRYGIGVRKAWGERFTGFFQAYFMNGGRTGVGLQSGLRFAVGKAGNHEIAKTADPKAQPAKISLNSMKK